MDFDKTFDTVLARLLVHLKSASNDFRNILKQANSFKHGYNTNCEAFRAKFGGKSNAFLEDNGPIGSNMTKNVELLDGFTLGDIYSGMNDVSYSNFLLRLLYVLSLSDDENVRFVKKVASKKAGATDIDGQPTVFNELLRLIANTSYTFDFQDDDDNENVGQIVSNIMQNLPEAENSMSFEEAKSHVLGSLEGTSLKEPLEKIIDTLSYDEIEAIIPSEQNDIQTLMYYLQNSNIFQKMMNKTMEMMQNNELPFQDLINNFQQVSGMSLDNLFQLGQQYMSQQ